jgi:hypothetical protein
MSYATDSPQVFSQPKIPPSYYEVRSNSGDSSPIPIPVDYYVRIHAEDTPFHEGYLAFRAVAYEIGHHLASTRLSRSYGSVLDKKQQFRDYFQQWKDQTGGMSSLTDITGNENYLNIISLGEGVVPDILKELQKEPLPLFLALRVLTKEKNVGADHSGDFRAIAREWIKWGKKNNKL